MVLFHEIGSKVFSFIALGIWRKLLAFLCIIDAISSSFHILLEVSSVLPKALLIFFSLCGYLTV